MPGRTRFPATGTVRRTYDESGNRKSLIDPTGKIAHFQYDAVNRADRTEDPAQGVRLFAYDLQDNPKLMTDANGNATSFKYDVHGREVERANALGNTWIFAYDSRDNMVQMVDAIGQTVNKTYDELNRMTGIEQGSAQNLSRFMFWGWWLVASGGQGPGIEQFQVRAAFGGPVAAGDMPQLGRGPVEGRPAVREGADHEGPAPGPMQPFRTIENVFGIGDCGPPQPNLSTA